MTTDRLLAILLLAAALPLGLSARAGAQEEDDPWDDPWAEESEPAVEFHGFVEGGLGTRLGTDPAVGHDGTLREARFRAELSKAFGGLETSFKADLVWDDLAEDELDYDIREALLTYSAGDVDLRAGRQVLTWGTGDLLFLNDLFPKDWVSFFAGRETSYLKAPSDSLKMSLYKPAINLDVVWTPFFEPDRFLDGQRFSYFSPAADEVVAAPPKIDPVEPPGTFDNGELALRLHRTLGSNEVAFYAYRGFFGQPLAFDPSLGRTVFPALSAWGASVRGPSWGGISNAEVVWYDSRDDRDGTDPFVPNSQLRLLLGHERELIRNLTLGLQVYLEGLAHHDRLLSSLPPAQRETAPDELRQVVTTRFTYRLWQNNLVLSLFAFLSPSDEDWFVLPSVGYRVSDRWRWDVGLNLFGGAERHTFFGQFENNSNAYTRVRYSF